MHQSVTKAEIEQTRAALADGKTPKPRNPKAADEKQEAGFACLRCGHQWKNIYQVNMERICPQCRSNSVRWLKKKEAESK